MVDDFGERKTGLQCCYRVRSGRDRQLRYAFKYWKRYNPEFWNFNEVGGDCGNFVNQTLLARGWTMTDDWRTGGDFGSSTPTWFNGPQMDAWFGARLERIPVSREDRGRSRLRAGDVAFFDWEANGVPNHTMIVSDVRERADGSTAVAFAGHNLDIRYRDLDDDVYREYPDAVVWCYAVRSSSTPS